MNESTLVPREEMNDLDWLARNVHKWPAGDHQPWCYVYMTYGGVMKAAGNFLDAVANPTMITIEQWLARRAELQNKPSWDLSGSWSEYLAQDMDGEWKWLGENPSLGDDHWTADELRSQCKGVVLGDWRDTLEKRPADLSEQAVTARLKDATDNVLAAVPELMTDKYKFTPFTSSEDNQEKDMKQDDGWFERGDLPPVGIAVQLWHGGTYAYDCELIAKRGNDFVLWNLTWDRPDSADCMMCVFKPTPTERDVLIEMLADFDGSPASAGAVADAILAAGFSLEAK